MSPALRNPPRLILAVDQAAKSGWCIVVPGLMPSSPELALAMGRRFIADAGTATNYGARVAVMQQLLQSMTAHGLTRADLRIVLEDHSHVSVRGKSQQRGPAVFVGMGKAWGRWEEQAQAHGVPLAHVHGVSAMTWRGALLGSARGGDEARAKAKELAEHTLGRECEENEAEAVCIGLWSAANLERVLRGEPAPKKPRAKRRKAAA